MQRAATAMYRYMFEQTHFASQPSSTVTMKSRRLADMAATDMESKVENTGESMIRLRKAAGITVNRNYVENNSSHNPNSPATARNRPQGRNGLTGTKTTPDQVRTYRKSAIIQPTYTYTCIYIFFLKVACLYWRASSVDCLPWSSSSPGRNRPWQSHPHHKGVGLTGHKDPTHQCGK